jgi:hypothetical protein
MVRPIDQVPLSLSVEEVARCAGHEVLAEVNVNNALIVGDPGRIFGQ